MEKLPKGLWPVMLTPFQEDNSVDYKVLEQLTEFYIATGANGLFANSLSSEMFQLTDQERISITQTVVKKTNGRIPVVSTGTFGRDLHRNTEFIKKLYDSGVQAVVINSNQLNDKMASEDAFKRQVEHLLNATGDISLGMYECPVPYKRLISPEMMQWLGKTGRFLYHKDTSCNLDDMREKIRAIKHTQLGLFNANTPTGLESLRMGARGLSPTSANYYPELFRYLIQHADHEDDKMEKLDATLSLLDSTTDSCYYPLAAKIFLQQRGLPVLPLTRVPVPALDQQDYIKLNAIMKIMNNMGDELGIHLANVNKIV